jgi:hypothetical protein
MGSAFETWNDVSGAIYMGAGTSWEVIWLLVSAVMCVAACWLGSKHENDAYKKMED